MQKTSTFPCNWRARSASLFPTPASCAFRMRLRLLSSATTARAPEGDGCASTRKICARLWVCTPHANMKATAARACKGSWNCSGSSPAEDVQSFVDAIAFNWLIAGTDAHAKNYSLLLGQNGVVRLAPFYDLASILPYPSVDMSKVKLAMKVGGEYRLRNIGLRHWQRLATELRLDETKLIDRIRAMAQAMPDQAATTQEQIEGQGLSHVTITRLYKRLATRAVACQRILQFPSSSARLPEE